MRLQHSLLALAATAGLASCDIPDAPDEVLYGVVTATNHDMTADFGAYANASIEPTIPIIDDTNSGVVITAEVTAGVIKQISDNLVARGYTVVPSGTAGALKVGAYALLNSQNLYYNDYYCSIYYYYYCTPTWTYAGSYNYGTLLIEAGDLLFDPSTAPPIGVPSQLIWTSATYGVMQGANTITTASPGYPKILASIDQAFAQSPYFTRQP